MLFQIRTEKGEKISEQTQIFVFLSFDSKTMSIQVIHLAGTETWILCSELGEP